MVSSHREQSEAIQNGVGNCSWSLLLSLSLAMTVDPLRGSPMHRWQDVRRARADRDLVLQLILAPDPCQVQ
jgi:hypothetical protein